MIVVFLPSVREVSREMPQRPSVSVCSVVSDFATPWTEACQAPLSMGFSRQEYWSRLSFPTPGCLLDPGIKPESLVSPSLAGDSLPPVPREKSDLR